MIDFLKGALLFIFAAFIYVLGAIVSSAILALIVKYIVLPIILS